MVDLTEFQAALAAHTANGIAFTPAGQGQFAAIPEGYSVESLEKYQETPDRHRANHKFVAVAALAEYLNRFSTEWTMVSADYAGAKIAAVIDGDAPGVPSHKEHLARFEAQLSDKVKAWMSICGKPLAQVQFGLFLEDRAVDVVFPDAADVMEMVMKFDATKKVSFKSSTRLHDGSRQFQYVEDNDVRGGVTLPDHFVIFAPVYRGMEPQKIKFMIRYRIEDGSLRFQVEMHDKDEVLREAFERCVDVLKADLKINLPIYVVG
ncbi:DUF2303 family protein [Oceaniglobus trochenteri]|uniref:DUF2303 family protein n=1 Tax=Oceaniglobus trochenteri TaxID=2763260 RepID=UPI001D000CFF|nr:DUF2303 family protein [Oceaniglobus trochenteri]